MYQELPSRTAVGILDKVHNHADAVALLLCCAAGRASRANAKAYSMGGAVQICTRRQAGAHPATRIRAGQVGEEQGLRSERGQEAERSAFQRAPLSCALHSSRRCSFVVCATLCTGLSLRPCVVRQPKHDAQALRSRRAHQAAGLHARGLVGRLLACAAATTRT